jgi:microcin C transport system substrate-binding protein
MASGHQRKRTAWRLIAPLLGILALALPLEEAPAAERTHGLSAFGDLKYPAGFKHFDYVNPDAPKGGHLFTTGTQASLTFDSFNPFIVRGEPAQGLENIYESLMVRANDEPDAVYGLIADWAEIAGDRHAVTFHIRSEAKWSDGTPITAEDCVYTLGALKDKGAPDYQLQLRDVTKAEALDPATVRYTFQGDNLRDLPLVVASLPVLAKSFWGSRDFAAPSLDVPLTSGPYKIGKVEPKSFIYFERRVDYWAKALPVNVGRYNFDTIKLDYYGDRTVGLQAFFAGDLDLWEEFSAKSWATSYDAVPVKAGKILRDQPPDNSPSGTQGFFFNLRRAKFADPRTRKALDLAFDFEWTHKNIFYGSYKRTVSYFENSPLRADGKPSADELALLDPFKDKLPPEVFGEAVQPATSDGSGQDRNNLHKARELLASAGWTVKDGKLSDAKGGPFTIEFLLDEPGAFPRILGPYIKNLQVLGIDAAIRIVDPAQYEERQKRFDYDVVSARYTMRLTPGVELRTYCGSAAADAPSSQNLAGIKDPVVDALIEKVAGAKSRADLTTAAHALDRVLRAGRYWVPEWYNDAFRLAYWDRFAKPATKPLYDRGVNDTWWFDKDKDAKLAGK